MTLKHVKWLSECAECAELEYERIMTLKKLKDSFDLFNILVSI